MWCPAHLKCQHESSQQSPAPALYCVLVGCSSGEWVLIISRRMHRSMRLQARATNAQSGDRSTRISKNPRTQRLRELLRQPGILKGPCCHDGLSARLIERAGFQFTFMSGFCTAGARLGFPDTGLITYSEMLDTGRNIHEATRTIPVIGDGDTGYGNAMNVKRTVHGYAQAGFAGILIEDQVAPKSCGHLAGKQVVSREEAVARIRAAVDAREEGADILILARTDARQAASMEEALWRVAAFADAGADLLFIDALTSEEEMMRFCWAGGAAARVPKMANMLEGGGKTPILPPQKLQDMGFKLVAYPLSLLSVSIKAMEDALSSLKDGELPPADKMATLPDMLSAVGYPDYVAQAGRYAVSTSGATATSSSTSSAGSSTSRAASDPSSTTTTSYATPASTPHPAFGTKAAAGPSAKDAPKTSSSATSSSSARAQPTNGRKDDGHGTTTSDDDEGTTSATSSTTTSRNTGTADATSSSTQSSTTSTARSSSGGYSGREGPSSGPSRRQEEEKVKTIVEPELVFESGALVAPQRSSDSSDKEGDDDANSWFRRARYFRVKITEIATGLVKLETRIPAGFMSGMSNLIPGVAGLNIESLVERARRERTGGDPKAPIVALPTGSGDMLEVFLE